MLLWNMPMIRSMFGKDSEGHNMTYVINDLLAVMLDAKASDLYLSIATYPLLKMGSKTLPIEKEKLDMATLNSLLHEMLSEEQVAVLEKNRELDFTISRTNLGRFRVNAFYQRGTVAFVLRRITGKIQSLDDLSMPSLLKELILVKRGLILVVGATGSGKSTTMAAMVDHRNKNSYSHILTLEDPVEYLHSHAKSIVNQREIGQDTETYANALRSALRQAPDLLLIGEIRDRETMSAALNFAETGHLVLSTLHANNAYQTLQRIMSFFPQEYHPTLQLQLSLNLKAVVGQRLIPSFDGGRVPALEIMLSSSRIRDLIHNGDIEAIRGAMQMSTHEGMQTFDQALYELADAGKISMDDAIQYADRATDLRLLFQSEKDGSLRVDDTIELDEK